MGSCLPSWWGEHWWYPTKDWQGPVWQPSWSIWSRNILTSHIPLSLAVPSPWTHIDPESISEGTAMEDPPRYRSARRPAERRRRGRQSRRPFSSRKGSHQDPQITYLQFCWCLVIFFFYSCCYQWLLLEGYAYMYTFHQIHVSIPFPLKDSYKHVFQIVSVTLLQGVGRAKKKIYIYITLLPGGVEHFFFARPPPPYSLWEENAQDVANGD